MTLVYLLEGILRGGAAALCVVAIIHFLSPRPITWPAIYGSLFFLGAGIYAVAALPPIKEAIGVWAIPLKTIGIATPAYFWLFVLSLNDDDYRLTWLCVAGPSILSGLFLLCLPFPEFKSISIWINITIVTLMLGHTVYIVRCCMSDDLVASRRHVSETLSWLIPFIAIAIMAVEFVEVADMRLDQGAPGWARMIAAISLITVSIVLATSLTTLRKTLLPNEFVALHKTDMPSGSQGLAAADRIDLGRIRDLMEDGAYFSPGLSIGDLARQLSLPEHRLRKLINGSLGYRNFAAFVNDYRIAEAKRRLAQPDLVHTQITSLAYDLGYQSLAPFNRAFRERAGVSPSEFREQALSTP
ncbi:MAG: AraC family transcriptional regulator [Pseudomonadota bacterium]